MQQLVAEQCYFMGLAVAMAVVVVGGRFCGADRGSVGTAVAGGVHGVLQ
jgi:hypothetical protein